MPVKEEEEKVSKFQKKKSILSPEIGDSRFPQKVSN
jgi:hypothetical protein